jgi:hypothetical protein
MPPSSVCEVKKREDKKEIHTPVYQAYPSRSFCCKVNTHPLYPANIRRGFTTNHGGVIGSLKKTLTGNHFRYDRYTLSGEPGYLAFDLQWHQGRNKKDGNVNPGYVVYGINGYPREVSSI